MTAVESSATSAMTDDKGDGTAVADLAMTDDCRVGHVSTVIEGEGETRLVICGINSSSSKAGEGDMWVGRTGRSGGS